MNKNWQNLIGKTVKFNSLIDQHEVFYEPNMIATIVQVEDGGDDSVKVTFDHSKYVEHNKALMTPNFYDKNGVPSLTWFETKSYPSDHKSHWYFGDEDVEKNTPFEVYQESHKYTAIYNEWFTIGSQRHSSVKYLRFELKDGETVKDALEREGIDDTTVFIFEGHPKLEGEEA